MKIRMLLLAGTLSFSMFSVANAKSYDITIDNPAKAGPALLAPGEYRVKVEGSNAVFTNVRTDQKFTAPVTVENSAKKHENTAVESNVQGGTEQIKAIELGGSRETLEFGD